MSDQETIVTSAIRVIVQQIKADEIDGVKAISELLEYQFQAREQQLLTELLGKAIEYKAPLYMPSGKAVPVSVIERLQNKTNDGGKT